MRKMLIGLALACTMLGGLTACGKTAEGPADFPYTENEMVRLGIVCTTHVWGDQLTDYLSDDLYQQFTNLPEPDGAVLDIPYDEFMSVLDESVTWTDTIEQVYSDDGTVSMLLAYGTKDNPTYLYMQGTLNEDNKFSELSVYSGTNTTL